MGRKSWSDNDQLVALYLARLSAPDASIESAFLQISGHTKKSLNMAISNFRFLLGGRGLKNVSKKQRQLAKGFGGLDMEALKARVIASVDATENAKAAVMTSTESSSGRRLTEQELASAREILVNTRAEIAKVSNGDPSLLWALRRKVYKELIYDERSKPMARRLLKAKLFAKQLGLCGDCKKSLPEKYSVLDRRRAMDGYTELNCRLLCSDCDQKAQAAKGYK
jgi:hypothetical protein